MITRNYFTLLLVYILGSCSPEMNTFQQDDVAKVELSSRVVISSGDQLSSTLRNARPGDVIELAPGVYRTGRTSEQVSNGLGGYVTRSWFFRAEPNGSASSPIILKSQYPSNPAILEGDGWNNDGYVLYITGDYWKVENIVVRGGNKGIILDNSKGSLIKGVEIYDIGQEGLHVRDGSCDTVIDGINLHDVGKKNDGFGEGIYVGSDNAVWLEGDGTNTGEEGLLYSREVHNTIIKNSKIGPNISAEPFDIKEGTTNTIVENNIIYGSGISGVNYADSHIDIKGTWAVVRYNKFYQSGNSNILRSIMIVPRQNAGVDPQFTGHHNYIHDNEFNLDSASVYVAVANEGSVENYAWNNIRIPNSGNMYNSRIIQAQPAGYIPPPPPSSDTTPPAIPAGLSATAASSSSITLDWADNTEGDLFGYNIYRGTTSGFTPNSTNFVKQVNNSSYTDTGLAANTTYYYKVTAVDTSGNESQPSAQVSAKTLSATDSGLKLYYQAEETVLSTKNIKFNIQLVNSSSSDENLNGYTIRYWFTNDGLSPVYSERYISFGASNADGSFGSANGMQYCEIRLTGGTILANNNAFLKITIRDSKWRYFNQSNDYSFDGTYINYAPFNKITMYKNGSLVWGIEP